MSTKGVQSLSRRAAPSRALLFVLLAPASAAIPADAAGQAVEGGASTWIVGGAAKVRPPLPGCG